MSVYRTTDDAAIGRLLQELNENRQPGPDPVVLATCSLPEEAVEPLTAVSRVVMAPKGYDLLPRAEVLRIAPLVSGILNHAELQVDAELLDAAPRLKVVANAAMGVDNFNLPLMQARGVWATNTPDSYAEATADGTLGLLLCAARKFVQADAYVRSGDWKGFQPGRWDGLLLQRKTLGLIGYGRIGKAVARRARAFGLRVLHYTRTPGDAADGYVDLDTLLRDSDIVSLHAPLNAESRHLLGRGRLAQMKKGALLINVGRGPLVDEAALVAALQSGHLAGAALDVFEHEPRVSPGLLTMPQVVLAPHLGGAAKESRMHSRKLAAENIAAVLRNVPPPNPVGAPAAASPQRTMNS